MADPEHVIATLDTWHSRHEEDKLDEWHENHPISAATLSARCEQNKADFARTSSIMAITANGATHARWAKRKPSAIAAL